MLPTAGTSWDHPGIPGYQMLCSSLLGRPGTILECPGYLVSEDLLLTLQGHARTITILGYLPNLREDHPRIPGILNIWGFYAPHYWDILSPRILLCRAVPEVGYKYPQFLWMIPGCHRDGEYPGCPGIVPGHSSCGKQVSREGIRMSQRWGWSWDEIPSIQYPRYPGIVPG